MYTAHNGLNLSKSVGKSNSRLEKVRQYLIQNGPSSKKNILREVFGKTLDSSDQYWVKRKTDPTIVNRGWNSTFFRVAVHNGFFRKIRKGNVTFWTAN